MKKNICLFVLFIWAIFSSVCAIQNAHAAERNLAFWNHYEKVFHTYFDEYWQLRENFHAFIKISTLRVDKDIDSGQ